MSTVSKYASYNTAITGGYTNPTNAYADNSTYATAGPNKNNELSGYYGFAGFSTGEIPNGSTINSVTVELEFLLNTDQSIASQFLQIFLSTTGVGTEQENSSMPTSETTMNHQVTSGITLSDLRTNDYVRGRLRSRRGNSNTPVTFSIDYVKITVDYTPLGSQFYETPSDGISLGDAITGKVLVFGKALQDGISLSDELNRRVDYKRTIEDGISLGEDLSRGATYKRTIEDGVSFEDDDQEVRVLTKELNDGISFAEEITGKEISTVKNIDDGISLADGISRVVSYKRTINDGISFTDHSAITWSNDLVTRISTFATRVGTEFKNHYSTYTHSNIHAPNSDNETDTSIATILSGVSADTVSDSDTFSFIKAIGGYLKKITWANIKATLKTYFDSLYIGTSGVNFTNLNANGSVGSSSSQVALGSHNHTGTYQPLDADLTSIAGLGFTSTAFLKKTATDTWTLDTSTYSSSTHTHGNITSDGKIGSSSGVPIITGTSGVLQVSSFGTSENTFCEGDDSRLSDTRTPTDATVSYAKVASDLTGRATDNDGNWDFSANGIVDAAISSNTNVTFSNLKQNKVLKVKVVITNSATITLPSYCTVLEGSADASGNNGTYYFYFDCWEDLASNEEVLVTITQAAT